MKYELYLDSLFVEYLCWNLCVLEMVNEGFWKSSRPLRLIFSALAGACGLVGVILMHCPFWGKLLGEGVAVLGMLSLAFPVGDVWKYGIVVEKFWACAVLFGSVLWFVGRGASALIPAGWKTAFYGILGIAVWGGWKLIRKKRKREAKRRKKVVLIHEGKRYCFDALIDSGNSLVEPISGKPVCVMDLQAASALWGEEDPCRVIPYCSVGTARGIMKAYLLQELCIEMEGPDLIRKNVFVAVSPKPLTCFLISPMLLSGGEQN